MSIDDRPGDRKTLDDAARVRRIAEIADAVGAVSLRNRAEALGKRLSSGRIYVACVGQVKRGKSSLLNALLGEGLLPTGIVPVTAVPTIIRYGDHRRARVQFSSGTVSSSGVSEIAQFVDEARNPQNVLGVEAVEVFVPSRLLETGLCLIDTPGLGSIIRAAVFSTHALVPHLDGVIVVLGVDPPLSGEELDLVTDVARIIRDPIVVLNKADRFEARDRLAARAFATEAMAMRIGRVIGPILEVSAMEESAHGGARRDWAFLIGQLTQLTSARRSALIQSALRRGAERLVEECLAELTELGHATYAPIAQLEHRLEKLRSIAAGTAFDSLAMHQLTERAATRVRQGIQERRAAFLAERISDAGYELTRAIQWSTDGPRTIYTRAMELAETLAHRELNDFSRSESEIAAKSERALAEQLMIAARAVLAAVSVLEYESMPSSPLVHEIDAPIPGTRDGDFLSRALTEPEVVTVRPKWTFRRFAYLIASSERARQLVGRLARDYLTALLESGATRIENALVSGHEEIGAAVEARLRTIVDSALERAYRTIEHVRRMRARDADAVGQELDRLAEWRLEVVGLRQSEDTHPSTGAR